MVNAHTVAKTLAKLAMLKYFPADKEARTAIVEMVCGMASDEAQVDWLVRRVLALFNEWPGPQELRAVFCSKFAPRDGINACSQVYLDGIPSERTNAPALPPSKPVAQLSGGGAPCGDSEMAQAIVRAADAMRLRAPKGRV